MKVVVFGAGRRVRGAVLPALRCLPEAELVGVVAKHERDLGGGVTSTTDARIVARADLVIVAVTTTAVPALLAQLAVPREAVVLLDTPVLPVTQLAALRHLRGVRRVVVSEDTLALPPFSLARRLVEDGAIGEIRRIYFFHNGYRYHALASLKALARAPIRSIRDRRFGKLRQKTMDLGDDITAVMYEPRDYATGKFRIEGTRGSIADHDFPGARRIGYVLDGPVYRGLTLDGAPVPHTRFDEAYLRVADARIHDVSPMNTMKLRGLVDVIAAAMQERSSLHYAPIAAIADALSIDVAERVGYAAPALFERALSRLAR